MTNLSENKWTNEKLASLGTNKLKDLFMSLPAPTIDEINGEYKAFYIGADNGPISNLIWEISANWNLYSGKWYGKSFKPTSEMTGYGFNNMKKFGMHVRRWPMKTKIGTSVYDKKDVYELDYSYYYSAAGIVSMKDEIRKVQDGLYLGIGHWKLPIIGIRMTSVWFTLSGPIGPFDDTGGSL